MKISLGNAIAFGVVVVVSLYVCYVFYNTAYQTGKDLGYAEGFEKGKAAIKTKLLEEKTYQDALANRELRDSWQEIIFFDEERRLYVTNLATPKMFPENMTYIWTDKACYAFKPNDFTFEEMYEFFLKKTAPEPDKFYPPAKFL